MMALTMFAPIVGLMYPINRINGSRAYSLNLWFKEYIGNLMIQPFHLFLYSIVIGSVMYSTVSNPIYILMALAGIMFIVKVVQDLIGIQDTRIGGLGQALKETTKAIKTTQKAATSVIRTINRTAHKVTSKGANTLGDLIDKKSSNEEEDNQQIREQTNPVDVLGRGDNEYDPREVGDPTLRRQHDQQMTDDSLEPTQKFGETLFVEPSDISSRFVDGEYGNPEEGIQFFDLPKNTNGSIEKEKKDIEVLNKGEDSGYQIKEARRASLLKDKEQLEEAIKLEEEKGQGNGYIAQKYRTDLEKVNKELDSLDAEIYIKGLKELENVELELSATLKPSNIDDTISQLEGINEHKPQLDDLDANPNHNTNTTPNYLDSTTISMVDELMSSEEKLIKTDRDRTVYRGEDGNLRIEGANNTEETIITDSRQRVVRTDEDRHVYTEENDTLRTEGKGTVIRTIDQTKDVTKEIMGNMESAEPQPINEFIKTNGSVKITRNDENGTLRLDPLNIPEGENPMSRAAGYDTVSSKTVEHRTIKTTSDNSRATINSGNSSNIGEIVVDDSRVISYENDTPSQSMPDGSNSRRSESSARERSGFGVLKGGSQVRRIESDNSQTNNTKNEVTVDRIEEPIIEENNSTSSSSSQRVETKTNSSRTRRVALERDNKQVEISTSSSSSQRVETNTNSGGTDVGSSNTGANPRRVETNTNSGGTDAGSSNTGANPRRVKNNTNSGGTDARSSNTGANPRRVEANTNSGGTDARSSNTGANPRRVETNTNNGGTDAGSSNTGANNRSTKDNKSQEKSTKKDNKESTTLDKVESAISRTGSVIGTAIDGVIDTALNVANGDLGGATDTIIETTKSVGSQILTGQSYQRATSSDNSKESTKDSVPQVSRDAKTIMDSTGLSASNAESLQNECKNYGINDDRNMVEVAKVWKSVSQAEKKYIVQLSKMLYECKANGESFSTAKRVLQGQVNSSTMDKFEKMYKNLHI